MTKLNYGLSVFLFLLIFSIFPTPEKAKAEEPNCFTEICPANDCYGDEYICIYALCPVPGEPDVGFYCLYS